MLSRIVNNNWMKNFSGLSPLQHFEAIKKNCSAAVTRINLERKNYSVLILKCIISTISTYVDTFSMIKILSTE